MLHLLHEREAARFFAIDLQLDENVFTRSVTKHHCDVALRDLQRLGFVLAAVDDRWLSATGLDFADRGTPNFRPPGGGEFYLFSHGFSYCCAPLSILKSDETDSSL